MLDKLRSSAHFLSAVAAAIALLGFVLPVGAGVLAGPVVRPDTGHAYYVLTPSTWTDSEAQAVSLGGHLVTINDPAENQWIVDVLGAGQGAPALWIGLTDRDVEGTWTWVEGDASAYRNFRPGEPNGDVPGWTGCDYATMYAEGPYAGLWNDTADDNSMVGATELVLANGVVEIPEPATVGLFLLGVVAVMRRGR